MEATIYNVLDQSKLYVGFPDGGKWVRGWLKEQLGSRVQLEWEKDPNTGIYWWKIAKGNHRQLAEALQARYTGVWIVSDYKTSQKCTSSCTRATGDDCVCSCLGANHKGAMTGGRDTEVFNLPSEVTRVTRYYEGTGNV